MCSDHSSANSFSGSFFTLGEVFTLAAVYHQPFTDREMSYHRVAGQWVAATGKVDHHAFAAADDHGLVVAVRQCLIEAVAMGDIHQAARDHVRHAVA